MNPGITSPTVSVDPTAAGQSSYRTFASIAVNMRLQQPGMALNRIILSRSNLATKGSNLG